MSKSRIEYVVNPDGTPGESWSPLTGCRHTLAQCPIADRCWARSMAHRFPKAAGGDFEPRFHRERITEPFKWRKPRRVAVCFTGDLFGEWVWDYPICRILDVVRACPQHTFLFLTKNPARLAEFNPWPPNAWVGASACDESMLYTALEHLARVEASVQWVSIEPILYSFCEPNMWRMPWGGIRWIVVGGLSGRKYPLSWYNEPRKSVARIKAFAASNNILLWEKNNLAAIMGRPLRQELPQ